MVRVVIYDITPCTKPRMTRGDKYQKRPRGNKYRAFKEECQLRKMKIPLSGAHIIFYIPMAKSWSDKKRKAMWNTPHQQTPDIDNLIKACLDSVYSDDSKVWDIRGTKKWAYTGSIEIRETT